VKERSDLTLSYPCSREGKEKGGDTARGRGATLCYIHSYDEPREEGERRENVDRRSRTESLNTFWEGGGEDHSML